MQSRILDINRVMSLLELDEPDGTDSFFADLVREFSSDADQLIQSIQRSIQQQDRAMIAAHSHSFRGASLNMGAVALADVCETLETQVKGSDLSSTRTWLTELENLYQATIRALETIKDQTVNQGGQHDISYR